MYCQIHIDLCIRHRVQTSWELKVEDQFEYILTQMNVNPVKLDENVVWVGLGWVGPPLDSSQALFNKVT